MRYSILSEIQKNKLNEIDKFMDKLIEETDGLFVRVWDLNTLIQANKVTTFDLQLRDTNFFISCSLPLSDSPLEFSWYDDRSNKKTLETIIESVNDELKAMLIYHINILSF